MSSKKYALTNKTRIPPELMPCKEDVARLKQIKKSLDKNVEVMRGLFKLTLKLYYELGSIILPWAQQFKGGMNVSLVEETFGIEMRKINTGVKIYKHFVTNPGLMDDLSISEALRLIDYRDKKEQKERERLTYQTQEGQPEFSWEDFFDIPPVAKVALEQFRLTCPNEHEVYLVERGQNYPVKVVELYTLSPDSSTLKLAHKEMLKNVQASVEKYYAQYEKEANL